MTKTLLVVAVLLVAGVPAAIGLIGNSSFERDVPVQVPDPAGDGGEGEEPAEDEAEEQDAAERREERREERAERREERREEQAERREDRRDDRDD